MDCVTRSSDFQYPLFRAFTLRFFFHHKIGHGGERGVPLTEDRFSCVNTTFLQSFVAANDNVLNQTICQLSSWHTPGAIQSRRALRSLHLRILCLVLVGYSPHFFDELYCLFVVILHLFGSIACFLDTHELVVDGRKLATFTESILFNGLITCFLMLIFEDGGGHIFLLIGAQRIGDLRAAGSPASECSHTRLCHDIIGLQVSIEVNRSEFVTPIVNELVPHETHLLRLF